jgi:hypothetical protein
LPSVDSSGMYIVVPLIGTNPPWSCMADSALLSAWRVRRRDQIHDAEVQTVACPPPDSKIATFLVAKPPQKFAFLLSAPCLLAERCVPVSVDLLTEYRCVHVHVPPCRASDCLSDLSSTFAEKQDHNRRTEGRQREQETSTPQERWGDVCGSSVGRSDRVWRWVRTDGRPVNLFRIGGRTARKAHEAAQ